MSAKRTVSHIKIYGERNTGTNYLQALISRNYSIELLSGVVSPAFQQAYGENEPQKDQYFLDTFDSNLGWKHAMAPSADQLAGVDGFERKILFITVTKNPYSWLLSLYRQPYHARQSYDSFAEFLETPWEAVGRELTDVDFVNPVDLWNRKNFSYLELAGYADCVNLCYEDLLMDAQGVLHRIAKDYALVPMMDRFLNLKSSTKGESAKDYVYYRDYYLSEKWRKELDAGHIKQINSWVDTNVLDHFRYQLIE